MSDCQAELAAPPAAILFDLDGVLVDSFDAWFGTLRAVTDEVGVHPISEERFLATYGQSTEKDVEDFFDNQIDLSDLRRRYAARFPEFIDRVSLVELELPGWLDTWRSLGIRLGIATNADRPIAIAMLDAQDLTELFDTIVTATGVAAPKPAPDMLLHACKRLGVSPRDAWFVGDSLTDVGAGHAAGIRMIGFRNPAAESSIDSLHGLLS